MSLVPCRACTHQVDTSALACPQCGATDPGKKLSRQERNLIQNLVLAVFWLITLGLAAWFITRSAIPMARAYLTKPPIEQPAPAPR